MKLPCEDETSVSTDVYGKKRVTMIPLGALKADVAGTIYGTIGHRISSPIWSMAPTRVLMPSSVNESLTFVKRHHATETSCQCHICFSEQLDYQACKPVLLRLLIAVLNNRYSIAN